MSVFTEHLDRLVAGSSALPPVIENLELGAICNWRPGYAKKIWQPDKKYFTATDVFGGYLAAIADQMLALASLSLLEDGQTLRTINLEIAFFEPVSEGPVEVEGEVIHRSRRLIHAEVTFRLPEGALAAKAKGVLQVITRPSAETAPGPKIEELWERAEKPKGGRG